MKNKMQHKNKVIREMKYSVVRRQEWAAILSSVSALGLAVTSMIIAFKQENYDDFFWLLILSTIIFTLMGVVSIILLMRNMKNIEKYRNEYNYYLESKKISDALLTAVKRTGFSKTNSILRSTYGTVPNWHPIDYCKNVLVYDVHEHLRDICVKMKELIISLYSRELNDDMVTVDIAFEYPSDTEFICNRQNEIKDQNDVISCAEDQNCCTTNECDLDLFIKKITAMADVIGNHSTERWKVITSGDRTASRINLHDYLIEMNSFYNHLQMQGYAFCNDKMELERENHYIWSSKDREYGQIGSVVGTVIELKNDNPEKVFVRVFLTITTYGRRFVENQDVLDVETFEKLFKETVINSYKTIIETELAQMFIRHGINNCFINRHTGKLCDQ